MAVVGCWKRAQMSSMSLVTGSLLMEAVKPTALLPGCGWEAPRSQPQQTEMNRHGMKIGWYGW